MAEPQPSSVREGADVEEPSDALPATAEDRRAAAALSSLTTHTDDADSQKPHMDQEALGKAMGKLGVQDSGKRGQKEGEGAKKKVKVDAADVGLLVSLNGIGRREVNNCR